MPTDYNHYLCKACLFRVVSPTTDEYKRKKDILAAVKVAFFFSLQITVAPFYASTGIIQVLIATDRRRKKNTVQVFYFSFSLFTLE